jgi:hypothetical protein
VSGWDGCFRSVATAGVARDFVLSIRLTWWAAIFSVILDERTIAASYLRAAIEEASGRPDIVRRLNDWGRRVDLQFQ